MKGGVASFEINLVYSVVTDNDGIPIRFMDELYKSPK